MRMVKVNKMTKTGEVWDINKQVIAKLIEFAQHYSQTHVSGYKFFSCCASCSTLKASVSATCVCVCEGVCVGCGGVERESRTGRKGGEGEGGEEGRKERGDELT